MVKQENSGVTIVYVGTVEEIRRNPRLGTEIDLGNLDDALSLQVVWSHERQAGVRSYHGLAEVVELRDVDALVDYDAALKGLL